MKRDIALKMIVNWCFIRRSVMADSVELGCATRLHRGYLTLEISDFVRRAYLGHNMLLNFPKEHPYT